MTELLLSCCPSFDRDGHGQLRGLQAPSGGGGGAEPDVGVGAARQRHVQQRSYPRVSHIAQSGVQRRPEGGDRRLVLD